VKPPVHQRKTARSVQELGPRRGTVRADLDPRDSQPSIAWNALRGLMPRSNAAFEK